ncbi:unnamed protein product [Clavelina lepadiformis]|uniref:Uncharacterized protein n=1 Tax=Clavelina lepadiformis TaxID=159417 RepID=A0ABP0G9U1_CLALP
MQRSIICLLNTLTHSRFLNTAEAQTRYTQVLSTHSAWLRLSPTFPPLRQWLGGIEATPELSSGGEDPSPRSSAKKKLKQTAPEISSVYIKTVPKHNSSGNETGPEINSCGKFLRMSISSSNVLGQMLKPALHPLVQNCEALRSFGRVNDPTVK